MLEVLVDLVCFYDLGRWIQSPHVESNSSDSASKIVASALRLTYYPTRSAGPGAIELTKASHLYHLRL